ncbi:hypothetical protein [Streptomyces sp.]|uniref:hypothetical protein n=1 Tax=Streptomyces sp. TaxID=1931 RepID=UPI002811498C|nr:hypothetical protein [Streptomyces sp.]
MTTFSVRKAAATAVVLAAFAVSCGGADDRSAPPPGGATTTATAGAEGNPAEATAPDAGDSEATPEAPVTPAPERVRDAFAGLQATLDNSCATDGCAYFLGRVHDELLRLERAMKADPKGPGHFPEPLALIGALERELGDAPSAADLEKHQKSLLSTRDRVNTWMQGHPDDYR